MKLKERSTKQKPTRKRSRLKPLVENSYDSERAHYAREHGWHEHLETGVLKAVVLANPHGSHFDRVVQAVRIVNAAQSYYRLELKLDEEGNFLVADDKLRPAGPIRARIVQECPNQLVIAMAEHHLTHEGFDLTIDEAPGCTIISCDDWDGYDDAPAMRVYLVYQLASTLITFAACLTVSENESLMHASVDEDDEDNEETEDEDTGDNNGLRGCLFDYYIGTENLYLSMVSARLCDRCRSLLLAHGAPPLAIAATEKLLDWVRSVILGREHHLPQKIFIGHGCNPDWKILRKMLQGWGLSVEEFNEEPVAGVSISERLKSMLQQSRFAFLVMTGEDKGDEGQLHARMNVIHEIGLFQGRLGPEYAIVLRRKDTSLFSNLDGINRLDYEKGKLANLKDEIRRLLIARGVMPAKMDTNHFAKDSIRS
jgi:hypothetical protein